MALPSKRSEELTAELQQILGRLSAVAEELATEAVSDHRYQIGGLGKKPPKRCIPVARVRGNGWLASGVLRAVEQ